MGMRRSATYYFTLPPRLELNRLKHLETARRRQRNSVDPIAEGKYFLFLRRLVDHEIYRLKIRIDSLA